jgi:hypothetical protein
MSMRQDALYETETMAELCATQGRLPEAIAIYRRLLDGHPGSDRCGHWISRLEALEHSWDHAGGEEIEPEPLPFPGPPGVSVRKRDSSVTVAWSLPPDTPEPTLELLLIQKTTAGVETARRSLRLPANEGRIAYAVPALHTALAAVGSGEGPAFVPLARSRR